MAARTGPSLCAAALLLVAAGGIAAGCGSEQKADDQRRQTRLQFASRPDLQPMAVRVTTPARGTAPGYLFLSPKNRRGAGGSLIVDDAGEVVWYAPLRPRQSADLRVQQYRGRPVLTWWEGTQPVIGIGRGKFVIADTSYRHIAELRAANGLDGDLHEFLITPQGTALIPAYEPVRFDLRRIGGPRNGFVYEGVVQELEIPSGRVLFEWHSLEHVQPREATLWAQAKKASASAPFDYFHINSIGLARDGNIIVSARNTSAIYKINRRDGSVMWRLGGRRSDFKLGRRARFWFQHDAREQPDGTISLFDNSGIPKRGPNSRALVLRLDMRTMRATVAREYVHPKRILSPFQGNAQFLPNGNVLVGWGSQPYTTEFSRDGRVLFDSRIAGGDNSYRAYRFPWVGRPTEPPSVAARQARDEGEVLVSASWNGATEVATWEVLAGDSATSLEPVARVPKDGFETEIRIADAGPYVAVRALDAHGNTLATSEAVQPVERAEASD